MNSYQETAKKILSTSLQFLIEEAGIEKKESPWLMNTILSEEDTRKVMRYFENSSELKAKIIEIKSRKQ